MNQIDLNHTTLSPLNNSNLVEIKREDKFVACRKALNESYQMLKNQILSLTLREFHRDLKTSHIRVISSIGMRYFKPEVVREILEAESCNLKGLFTEQASISANGLRFIQNPNNPFLDRVIHSFFFHFCEEFLPASELCFFEVDGEKSYPVLISRDIKDTSIEDFLVKQSLDQKGWKRWTWLLIGLILVKPSNGIIEKYALDAENRIYCVDNSLLVKEFESFIFDGDKFCSFLFCLFQDRHLDTEVLQEFCKLNSDEILENWINHIIEIESEFSSYPSYSDINFSYFKQGVLASINYQFHFLQNEIAKIIQFNKIFTPLDLLEKMIDFRGGNPDTSIGKSLSNLYRSAAGETIQAKFHSIIAFNQSRSFTSLLKDQAFGLVARLNFEPLKYLSNIDAKQELYTVLVREALPLQSETCIDGEDKIALNFKKVGSNEVQKLLLHFVSFKVSVRLRKPISISLQNCSVLDSALLLSFLHEDLEYLDLRNCHKLHDRDLDLIRKKCPQLKELDISGCLGIYEIRDHYRNHLSFPHLNFICFDNCKNLVSVKLCSPCLDVILGNGNLKLNWIDILTLRVPGQQFINCPNLDSKMLETELSEVSQEKKERFCKEFQAQKEFMIEIARQYHLDFQNVNDAFRGDFEFMLEAIKTNRFALTFASDQLKNNPEFMLSAIKIDSDFFEYASDSLKNDRKFVIQSLKINGTLFKYLKHFNNDREIVLEAVLNDISDLGDDCLLVMQNDDSILVFASEELRNDRDLVLAAIKKNKMAYQYASEELKNDLEIQSAAGIEKL